MTDARLPSGRWCWPPTTHCATGNAVTVVEYHGLALAQMAAVPRQALDG